MNSDDAALRGDWAGRHRTLLRGVAVVCGIVGVAMNLIHESGHRTFLSTVIGLGFLVAAVLAWNAPNRTPRPGKYPERFDKR
ncbi:MAG: hypothetical protein WAW88_04585 [Nocardioides sp.]